MCLASQAPCDMGSIPFEPEAKVLEPDQRALIACNGKEEILILSTDLSASQETKVLEVMPFPSEPKVTEADADIFKKATNMINEKLPHRIIVHTDSGGDSDFGDTGDEPPPPAGTVTFHERIGAHDISVVHAERLEGFVTWVKDYLTSQRVGAPGIPEPLEEVIEEYIKENFTWFVFDVVSLSKKPVTKEAIQFRFVTKFLYYPMRITRTEYGVTNVKLLIITQSLFDEVYCLGIPREKIMLVHRPVNLIDDEVEELSEEIFTMLGRPTTVKIRTWRILGKLDSFKDDVVWGEPRDFLAHIRKLEEPDAGESRKTSGGPM